MRFLLLPLLCGCLLSWEGYDEDDIDKDGDHWTLNEGDCDDGDPDINPNESEFCFDDIDNNCDDLVDLECQVVE